MSDHDPARIVENIMDGVRAAKADDRQVERNASDALECAIDLASTLTPERHRIYWFRVMDGARREYQRCCPANEPTPAADYRPGGAIYDAIAQEERHDAEDAARRERERTP